MIDVNEEDKQLFGKRIVLDFLELLWVPQTYEAVSIRDFTEDRDNGKIKPSRNSNFKDLAFVIFQNVDYSEPTKIFHKLYDATGELDIYLDRCTNPLHYMKKCPKVPKGEVDPPFTHGRLYEVEIRYNVSTGIAILHDVTQHGPAYSEINLEDRLPMGLQPAH